MVGFWRWRPQRSRRGTEWAILLVMLLFIFGTTFLARFSIGKKLLADAVGLGAVVGVLLGTLTPGSLCGFLRRGTSSGSLQGQVQAVDLQRGGGSKRGSGSKRAAAPRRRAGRRRATVTYSKKVMVKYVPNLCEYSEEWKARLWWQPADFAEFLRVRVLIGRAYHAVARRRGVKVDEDFPAEPVLSHESRLGLHLGRQSRRERNRKKYHTTVLEEQFRQRGDTDDLEAGFDRRATVDPELLGKVARKASRRDAQYAVEEARRHYEKVLKDLEEPSEQEMDAPQTPLQKARHVRKNKSVPAIRFPSNVLFCATETETSEVGNTPRGEAHSPRSGFGSTPEQISRATRKAQKRSTMPVALAISEALQAGKDAASGASASAASKEHEGDAAAGWRPGAVNSSTSPGPCVRQLSQIIERQVSETQRQVSETQRQVSETQQKSLAHRQTSQRQTSSRGLERSASDKVCRQSSEASRQSSERSRTSKRGVDTRGFGLSREEMERMGVSPTGHLVRHSPTRRLSEAMAAAAVAEVSTAAEAAAAPRWARRERGAESSDEAQGDDTGAESEWEVGENQSTGEEEEEEEEGRGEGLPSSLS